MALFTIQRSYKQHQRYKFCSQKSSLTDIHKHTHRERETHSLPFCENANKANDWLIISPTCTYHYLVWSSLSISPSTLTLHPSFHTYSPFLSSKLHSFQLHETMRSYQLLIINIWLLQGAAQLKQTKKKGDYNNPRESYTGNQLHLYQLSHSCKSHQKAEELPTSSDNQIQGPLTVIGERK